MKKYYRILSILLFITVLMIPTSSFASTSSANFSYSNSLFLSFSFSDLFSSLLGGKTKYQSYTVSTNTWKWSDLDDWDDWKDWDGWHDDDDNDDDDDDHDWDGEYQSSKKIWKKYYCW